MANSTFFREPVTNSTDTLIQNDPVQLAQSTDQSGNQATEQAATPAQTAPIDAEQGIAQITEWLKTTGQSALQSLQNPWTLYQAAILIGAFLVSLTLSKILEPRLQAIIARWIKNEDLLRIVNSLASRMEWVIFIALTYAASLVVGALTWSSRTFFLGIAVKLAIAWLVIAILSNIVRNKSLSKLIFVVSWIVAALMITGTFQEVKTTLDAVALQIGSVRLSVLLLIQGLILIIALLWFAGFVGNFAESRINRVDDLDPSLKVLTAKIIKISLVIIALALALAGIGIDLTALTVFSGAVGVGLGFGLQKVVSNFISGVIILLDKSIKPGDTISLGDTFGWIRELRARFVSVITRDGKEFLIPNEDFITQQVVNWSYSNKLVRLDVKFGVSYKSNPHEVIKLAKEVVSKFDRVSDKVLPVCWMTEFGDSSLNFVLRFWITDPQSGLTNIRGMVLLALWDVFDENDISIPFPHREIIMQTPVELVQGSATKKESSKKKPKSKTQAKATKKAMAEDEKAMADDNVADIVTGQAGDNGDD